VVAIIPLAKLLADATEELANHFNQVVGALLNATFGNAVELITAIIALAKDNFIIVKASLLGSVISDELLVLGSALLIGGFKHKELTYNQGVASSSMWLLIVFAIGLAIPVGLGTNVSPQFPMMGRLTSIIFIIIYIGYLIFQLKTHRYLYENDDDDDDEPIKLSIFGAIIALGVTTVLVAIVAEFLVTSMNNFANEIGINKTFAAFIMIPIASNAAEHGSAILVAMKAKTDLSIGCAINSGSQVALLILPVLILIAWPLKKDSLILYYSPVETVALFLSTYFTEKLLSSGSATWLNGLCLCSLYIIIAITIYYVGDN